MIKIFIYGHKHHSISALGLLILPQTWSYVLYGETLYRPWRLLMVTYKIPGFIALTILYFLKESPRYYLSKVFSFKLNSIYFIPRKIKLGS